MFDEPESNYDKVNDVVLLVGDFNVNATLPLNNDQRTKYDEIRGNDLYAPILPLFVDEYRSMLNALKNQSVNSRGLANGWTLFDCLRNS